jgi:hypothetical protein
MTRHETFVLENAREVLQFLKSRFPLYHQSNIFFRDVQYGILAFLERKGRKIGYTAAEAAARAFIARLEKENILQPIDRQSWMVNLPEFKTPVTRAAPAAAPKPAPKPATPAAAVPASPPAAGQ